jgi:hypothetical protein
MINKTVPDQSSITPATEEFKDANIRYNLSKFEYDLYVESDDIAMKVIRVKRFSTPNKGERWKVYENDTIIHVIEGQKLSKKECEFLRTVDGANWMLSVAKVGIKSFNAFKKELKCKLK